MKSENLLSDLKQNVEFPRHGWAVDDDNCIYLLFPILRAVWEIQQGFIEGTLTTPLKVRDFDRMGGFQGLLFKRMIPILGKIARAEELILSGADRNGAPIEEWMPVKEAEDYLPIWVECFYIYFKVLADYLVVALGLSLVNRQAHFQENTKIS